MFELRQLKQYIAYYPMKLNNHNTHCLKTLKEEEMFVLLPC